MGGPILKQCGRWMIRLHPQNDVVFPWRADATTADGQHEYASGMDLESVLETIAPHISERPEVLTTLFAEEIREP